MVRERYMVVVDREVKRELVLLKLELRLPSYNSVIKYLIEFYRKSKEA
jgi:hypothetical protein